MQATLDNWCGIMLRVYSGLILVLRPANEWRRYFVTTSIIGRVQD